MGGSAQYYVISLNLMMTFQPSNRREEGTISPLIRELGPGDAEAYKSLRLKALSEHPEAFGQSFEEAKKQTIEEIRREIMGWQSAGGFALAAFKEGGSISGMIALGRSKFEKMRHRGHVWGVYVDPSTRGQGIATKLFDDIISRASNSPGLVQLDIEVVTENRVAFDLYRKIGFVVVGEQPRAIKVNGKYFDEYLLVRHLDSDGR
jgi:ribosomal protein S18 acetylase RimI-like enzyme